VAGPDPAVAAVRSAVRAELADLADPADGSLVLVACSGGPDSLALAAATAFVADRSTLRAGAVVVDHGWHDGSAEVARAAAAACRALGLDPVEVVTVGPDPRVGTSGGGPEAHARSLRYAALDDAAARYGAAAVLLGHTLDDQAETVLLGLARGSGARSLAGMPARRGVYRRPLLGLPRSSTVQACAAAGLAPWSDPANADAAYARARLRSAMGVLDAALGPGLPQALARTADLLREDAAALDALADQLLTAATLNDPLEPDGALLDVEVLAAGPDAVRRRALLAAIRRAGGPAGAVGRRHVLAVDALVVAWRGQGVTYLPGGVVAVRDCGRLRIASPQQAHARSRAGLTQRVSTDTQE
jgi:tRNA(Ile)-lysidine synthase